MTYNLATLPAVLALGLVVDVWAMLTAAPWLMIAPLLSRWIHPYLHLDHETAIRCAPSFIAILLGTPYFRAVARHHYLHHKYPNKNFNLLLGGDWILGRHRSASADDIDKMKALGLRID